MLIRSLCDDSQEVRDATTKVLLPSVLAWAHELDKLQSDLLDLLLNQLELTISVSKVVESTSIFRGFELDDCLCICHVSNKNEASCIINEYLKYTSLGYELNFRGRYNMGIKTIIEFRKIV